MSKEAVVLSRIHEYYASNNAKYELVECDFNQDMVKLTIVADVPDKGAYTVALDLIDILTPTLGLFDLETPTKEMWETRRY